MTLVKIDESKNKIKSHESGKVTSGGDEEVDRGSCFCQQYMKNKTKKSHDHLYKEGRLRELRMYYICVRKWKARVIRVYYMYVRKFFKGQTTFKN